MESLKHTIYTFYKITCKDETVPGIYVGSSNNYAMRTHQHNSDSKNETKTNKLYDTIRANGGIVNLKFIVLEICGYQPQTAFNKELYFIDVLDADLNTKMPYRSLEEDNYYREDNPYEIAECRKQFWSEKQNESEECRKQF